MKPGPDPFAVPSARPEHDDTTRECGRPTGADPGAPGTSRLARRDPDAPLDDSAEFQVRGAVSFEDLLRRAQRRGFAAGAAAGGLGALLIMATFSWVTLQPGPSPGRTAVPEPQPAFPEVRALPPPVADAQALLGSLERAPRPVRPEAPVARRSGKPRDAATGVLAPAPAQTPAPAEAPDDVLVLPAMILSPEGTPPPAPVTVAEARPTAAPPSPAAQAPDPAQAPAAPPRKLEQAEVSAALAARRGAIEACLAVHPADAVAVGARRFHLDVTVVDSGRVSGAEIDDAEVRGTALGGCVLGVARGITFPAFDGEPVRVELPLRLAARE